MLDMPSTKLIDVGAVLAARMPALGAYPSWLRGALVWSLRT